MTKTFFMKKYWIIGIAFTLVCSGCLFFRPSPEKMVARSLKRNPQYDAIIVPGVPFNQPYWDRIMQARVLWAVHLYDRGIAKHIIMSGNAVYTPYKECNIMKLYAIALGVPEKDIFIEDKALHSTENIWYGSKVAKANGFSTIALATDPTQTKLLYGLAKRRVKGLAFLPILFDTLETLPHDTPSIDYQPYKVENFISLPERQNKFQRLMGTLGKHIKYREKN